MSLICSYCIRTLINSRFCTCNYDNTFSDQKQNSSNSLMNCKIVSIKNYIFLSIHITISISNWNLKSVEDHVVNFLLNYCLNLHINFLLFQEKLAYFTSSSMECQQPLSPYACGCSSKRQTPAYPDGNWTAPSQAQTQEWDSDPCRTTTWRAPSSGSRAPTGPATKNGRTRQKPTQTVRLYRKLSHWIIIFFYLLFYLFYLSISYVFL